MKQLFILAAFAILLPGSVVWADEQVKNAFPQNPCAIPATVVNLHAINESNASLDGLDNARILLKQFFKTIVEKDGKPSSCLHIDHPLLKTAGTRGSCQGVDLTKVDVNADEFYALVHIVKWSTPTSTTTSSAPSSPTGQQGSPLAAPTSLQDAPTQTDIESPIATGQSTPFPASAGAPPSNVQVPTNNSGKANSKTQSKQTIEKQNWYVYHAGDWTQEDFTTGKHLPGVRQVWIVYIHLGAQSVYAVKYPIQILKTTPTPLANAFQLLEIAAGSGAQDALAPVWGGGLCRRNLRSFDPDLAADCHTCTAR
jgi:hypothetical protein